MRENEVPLVGNVTSGVVRIKDTVRRPVGPSSEGVDALLRHFEAVGFTGAPRALGRDERGRQVLEFIDGDVGDPDIVYQDADLEKIAHLLRDLHQASASFPGLTSHTWEPLLPCPPGREPVLVCHNDAAPWNLVRRADGCWALIDWDGAAPGTRGWELAYTAQTALRLAPGTDLDDALRRLELFLRAYGPGLHLEDLPRLLAQRPLAMADMLHAAHDGGIEPWARIHREDGAYWRSVAGFLAQLAGPLGTVTRSVAALRDRP